MEPQSNLTSHALVNSAPDSLPESVRVNRRARSSLFFLGCSYYHVDFYLKCMVMGGCRIGKTEESV